jgi:hypothetical protein
MVSSIFGIHRLMLVTVLSIFIEKTKTEETNFEIYVFITITVSIPLLVDQGYHLPSSQCFRTDVVY